MNQTNMQELFDDIYSRQITYEENYSDTAEYVWWHSNGDETIPLAALGDITYIWGPEKSRKTLLKDCIVASNYTSEIDSSLNFSMKLPPGSSI